MKIKITRTVQADARQVRVSVPIRYDEDKAEILGKFGVSGDTLALTIGIDDGQVFNWPPDAKGYSVHLKVVDEGTYVVVDASGEILAEADCEYVPSWFPGDHYGDYLILDIDDTGKVTNWRATSRPHFVADWLGEHGDDE